MKYYDLHSNGNSPEMLRMAKILGWSGLAFQSGRLEELKGVGTAEVDIAKCLVIDAKNPSEVHKIVSGARKRVELIAVNGGNLEINRAAVELPGVDMLVRPWGHIGIDENLRADSGINHVIAKLARKNNVSIVFDFCDLMHSYKKTRSELARHMIESAATIRKYKVPFLLSSGALSQWDLRSPLDLVAFGKVIGFHEREAKNAISGGIVMENRKRLGSKWIMPGIEIE